MFSKTLFLIPVGDDKSLGVLEVRWIEGGFPPEGGSGGTLSAN